METFQTRRATVPALEEILYQQFPVHDKGFVRVIDYMGSDASVCQMARVSYGAGTKKLNEDTGLIRYLLRHRHTSPFEGNEIKLHLKMPLFVARQWIRHRTANVNEYSARYSVVKDEFFIPRPEDVKLQSKTNKQGRSEETIDPELVQDFISHTQATAGEAYEHYLEFLIGGGTEEEAQGIAREMARINLPLTSYTEMYWKIDLHNLLHFVSLRSDPHAQKEIRDFSDVIFHTIIKAWCPAVYQAALDYIANGAKLSSAELKLLKLVFDNDQYTDQAIKEELLRLGSTAREVDEFLKKVR